MQFTLSALIVAALTASVLADKPASECGTGPVQCCNTSGAASDPSITPILNSLGIVVTDPTTIVGVNCSPITVGIGGDSCSSQTLCCENNSFNGVVAIGCVAVNINL